MSLSTSTTVLRPMPDCLCKLNGLFAETVTIIIYSKYQGPKLFVVCRLSIHAADASLHAVTILLENYNLV